MLNALVWSEETFEELMEFALINDHWVLDGVTDRGAGS